MIRFLAEFLDALIVILAVGVAASVSGWGERAIAITAITFGVASTLAVRSVLLRRHWNTIAACCVVGSLASGVTLLVMAGFLVSSGVDRLSVGVASVVSFAVLVNWVAIAIGRRRIRLSPSGSAGVC